MKCVLSHTVLGLAQQIAFRWQVKLYDVLLLLLYAHQLSHQICEVELFLKFDIKLSQANTFVCRRGCITVGVTVVQWIEITPSNGPKWVGASEPLYLRMETDNSFQNMVFHNNRHWTNSRNSIILKHIYVVLSLLLLCSLLRPFAILCFISRSQTVVPVSSHFGL